MAVQKFLNINLKLKSGILGRIPSTESISQGSVLGNTLFILAMNSLAKRIPRINCSVDMTAIWIVYSEVQKGTNILQSNRLCLFLDCCI